MTTTTASTWYLRVGDEWRELVDDPARYDEIEALLPPSPKGVGGRCYGFGKETVIAEIDTALADLQREASARPGYAGTQAIFRTDWHDGSGAVSLDISFWKYASSA